MAKCPVRTDGVFAQFYAATDDVRAVVAAYRGEMGCSYREAWGAWFAWAMGGEPNKPNPSIDAFLN